MKEHPILFSGAMVRALLAGRKTQTRRAVKPQPMASSSNPGFLNWTSRGKVRHWNFKTPPDDFIASCPYGVVGDRLWVRETWRQGDRVQYRADGETPGVTWRPSIFMPRAASRLSIELTAVRVERLHSISDADCLAEGIDWPYPSQATKPGAYKAIWSTINGEQSWDSNPWVWVLSFRRLFVIPHALGAIPNAVTLRRADGTPLRAGDLVDGQVVEFDTGTGIVNMESP